MPSETNIDSSEDSENRGLGVAIPTSYATYIDRWAIVVGISKYKYDSLNLKYADRDAEELVKVLQSPSGGGFEKEHIVKLVNEDATTANITRALRSFLKKPAKDDIVLIYFACHGAPDIDRPHIVYLLTHDTDPRDISGTALPMREVDLSLKENLLAERVIVIADTCHSAAIGGGIGRRSAEENNLRVVNRYLQELVTSKKGLALLTSAAAEEVSLEDEKWGGGHGVFTHYLLEGMRGAADYQPRNGIVTVRELFEYVRKNVQKATGNKQHPCIGTNPFDGNLPIAITAGISAQEHYELGCQLYQLGLKLEDKGRFESASTHLQEAIRLSRATGSKFPEAHLQLGLALMAAGNLPKAIEAFETATKANLADAAYYLGMTYAKQGESEKSMQALESFLNKYPQDEKVPWVQEFIAQQAQQHSGTKYALLIGIDVYPPESGFAPLKGPVNDVQLIRELLLQQYAFPPENINVLTDKNATYERILMTLQELAVKAKSNDIVVIHFSGHASESSDYQHYLIVYDSVTSFGKSNSISRDEESFTRVITAQQLHNSLNAILGNKTLILDTHANSNFIDLAHKEGNYTLFLGTSPGLMAYERRVDGKRYGFFTYSFVEQLRQLVASVELRHLHELVTNRIQSLGGKQLPIFIGNSNDYFFSNRNYFIDFFNFSQRQNYSAFTQEQIEQQYTTALKHLTVPFSEFYYSLGRAFFEKNDYQKSISNLQKSLVQTQQTNPDILLAFGTAQLFARQYSAASKTLHEYMQFIDSPTSAAQIQQILSTIKHLESPQCHALLIGVNNYLSSTVPKLCGAVNDVLALEAVLMEKYNFNKVNIKILLNSEATSKNILDTFKELATKSQEVPALFYFAGNGSLNVNENLTILGVDSRQPDIYDIEINELIEIVGERPTNLVTVIDAGWTNAISASSSERVAPPDTRPIPSKRALIPLLSKTRDLSSINLKIGYTSIYSKSPLFKLRETSETIQGERIFDSNGKMTTHGILTQVLIETLKRSDANTLTYTQLVRSLSDKFKLPPVIVGDNLNDKVFINYLLKRSVDASLKQIEQEPIKQIVSILQRLIEQRNGFDPEGHLNLGVTYYLLGEYEKSITTLESTLAEVSGQHPKMMEQRSGNQQDYPEAHYWLGRVLYESDRDLARAVSGLRLATQQDPTNVSAHYYLGQALRALVKQEILTEAERAFETYLKGGSPLGQKDEVQEFLRSRNSISTQ